MANLQPLSVETNLNGYFRADYSSQEKTVIDILGKQVTKGVIPPVRSTIHDARELQAFENDTKPNFESRFFDKHGFVLLSHESQVQDWDSGAFGQTDAVSIPDRKASQARGVNEIELYYMAEVDDLIRNRLLPGVRVSIDQPNMVMRRGRDTANPFYGLGIHNDYGITADDFQENLESFSTPENAEHWRTQYEADDVQAFMVINFWRPVHMSRPVEHMPLAVLDASSVAMDDVVSSGLKNFSLTGKVTNQLSLRHNSSQAWYYYPHMTNNEVMALNLFHIAKDKEISKHEFVACYHTAFENPLSSKNAEERQSCEHRVSVFIMKD